MAAMVSTDATMDKWVMKLVNLQKLAPKIQSLQIFNPFVILNIWKVKLCQKQYLLYMTNFVFH